MHINRCKHNILGGGHGIWAFWVEGEEHEKWHEKWIRCVHTHVSSSSDDECPLRVECTDKEHHTCTFISGRMEENEHARKYKKVNQKPSCKPVNEKVLKKYTDCEAPPPQLPPITNFVNCLMLML